MSEIREVLHALEEQGFFPPADPKWATFKRHSSSVAQKLGDGAVHLLRLAGGWQTLKLRRTVLNAGRMKMQCLVLPFHVSTLICLLSVAA